MKKVFLRAAVFFGLIMGVILVSRPAAVSAFQDCCQTCEDRYEACLSACTTAFCKSGCEIELRSCIEICPACISEN
jgi:hypothetical protein